MSTELPTLVATGNMAGSSRRAGERQRRVASWGVSAAVHVVVAAVIIVEIIVALLFVVPATAGRHAIELAVANEPIELAAEPLATLPIESPPDPTAAAVADLHIAELAAVDITPELARKLLSPDDSDDVEAANWVLARVTQEIAAAEKLSQEEQYQRLEQLTGTLNAVGTEPGVEEATAQLAKLLSTKPRATEPAKDPPPGEFDLDSAQLYDIKRTDNGSGGFTYAAVLLDAEGRTLESELTEAEGEQLYRTFELMKANPLLARVYRGVVMGLLDKLLRPAGTPK